MYRRPVPDRAREVGHHLQPQRYVAATGEVAAGQPAAATDLIQADARQVQRAAVSGSGFRGVPALRADASHPRAHTGGKNRELFVGDHGPRVDGARHDQAGASDVERAVDGEPEASRGLIHAEVVIDLAQMVKKLGDAFSGRGRSSKDGSICEKGVGSELANLVLRLAEPEGVDTIAFRERDGAGGNPQQLEDLQVLAALRHGAVIGRDDHQRVLHGRHARDHVVDEPVVPGHVDEADGIRVVVAADVRESKIDGEPAAFLFFEAVGVLTRQAAHQARFAMVDVPRKGNDHGALSPCRTSMSSSSGSAWRTSNQTAS